MLRIVAIKLVPALSAALSLCSTPLAFAQWRNAPPDANVPRTASGEVDLEAPPPRHANGRVDLEGIWMPNDNRYIRDLALGRQGRPRQQHAAADLLLQPPPELKVERTVS